MMSDEYLNKLYGISSTEIFWRKNEVYRRLVFGKSIIVWLNVDYSKIESYLLIDSLEAQYQKQNSNTPTP